MTFFKQCSCRVSAKERVKGIEHATGSRHKSTILPQGSRLGVLDRGIADALLVVQGVKTGLGSPEIEDRRGPDVYDGLEQAVLAW